MTEGELQGFYARFTGTWGRRWTDPDRDLWARDLRQHDAFTVRAAFDECAKREPEGPCLARFMDYVRSQYRRTESPRRDAGCPNGCPDGSHGEACRESFRTGIEQARRALRRRGMEAV